MENNKYFKILLFNITLYILCFFETSFQHRIKLDLNEGDICRKGKGTDPDYVCMYAENCESLEKNIQNQRYPDICSFNGSKPIICCSPTNTTKTPVLKPVPSKRPNIVAEKCEEYIKLANNNFQQVKTTSKGPGVRFRVRNTNAISVGNCESDLETTFNAIEEKKKQIIIQDYSPAAFNGVLATPKEFPHMVLLGYGMEPEENIWACGGSLISERWILTAAHCEQMGSSDYLARWARLGDLNVASTTDDARPKDYRIVQRVIHPCYEPPSRYNDIALFRLETDVVFSEYVRPICLNWNSEMDDPESLVATGWGVTQTGEPTSDDLLLVVLKPVAADQCNNSYVSEAGRRLKYGILLDRMICAASEAGKKIQDTCSGDSGGPLQSGDVNFLGSISRNIYHTQYGITSFGSRLCGDSNLPGVYTRVSKYISWIEDIVWPYF